LLVGGSCSVLSLGPRGGFSSQALWCKWELMVGDNGRWMKAGERL
jgi:hypothetical protein